MSRSIIPLKFRRRLVQSRASRFSDLQTIDSLEMLNLHERFKEDTFPDKVNLVSGVFYLDDNTQWNMPLIINAGKAIAGDEILDKDYHYTERLGLESFTFAATKLLLGAENRAIIEDRCFGIQTLGASGAFCLGAKFLNKHLGYNTYYVTEPSRLDHNIMFASNGFSDARVYRYFNDLQKKTNMTTILQDLGNAPPNSVIVLQMVAHNPTGCDLTKKQWMAVADVMEERKLFPFFDCTFQGFGSGNMDFDAYPVRLFAERGFEMFCAQSFSKNFGLYDESIGNLLVILNTPKRNVHVRSQFLQLVSCTYSYPSYYGARIVAYILNNPLYLEQWKVCIAFLSNKVKERRNALRRALERLQTPGIWEHITHQIGVYSYSGLDPQQSKEMLDKYHIYILSSGRLSFCGITTTNVDYVAKAINNIITKSLCKQSALLETFVPV